MINFKKQQSFLSKKETNPVAMQNRCFDVFILGEIQSKYIFQTAPKLVVLVTCHAS